MRLISWNVNGLRAVVNKGFLEYWQNNLPDVLCLQETKLQLEQVPLQVETQSGYYKYFSCAERKGYSGVALFSKEEPRDVQFSMGAEEFDREGRTIIADYEKFTLINCYFPNGQMNEERLSYKLRFYDRMLEIMEDYTKRGVKLLVCGDYNTAHREIDLKHPKENENTSGFLPIERAWIDKIIAFGYTDTFRQFNHEPNQYSWWTYRANARTNNVGWRIDYFFANRHILPAIKNAFIEQSVFGSDHCPVGVSLSI